MTRALFIAYMILAGASLLLCLLCPYGSASLSIIQWWTPVGVISCASLCLFLSAKGVKKWMLPIGLVFFISTPVTQIVSSRNKLYIATVTGVITRCYVGRHTLKSLEIKASDGTVYRLEGLPTHLWETVKPGDSFSKNRGFQVVIQGQTIEVERWAQIWKVSKYFRETV